MHGVDLVRVLQYSSNSQEQDKNCNKKVQAGNDDVEAKVVDQFNHLHIAKIAQDVEHRQGASGASIATVLWQSMSPDSFEKKFWATSRPLLLRCVSSNLLKVEKWTRKELIE